MENYEFYYKDVWERTLDSIKREDSDKIKEEDFYYFSGSRLYDCNDSVATISTPLEVYAIFLNNYYKEIISAHLSKILNKDLQVFITPEKNLISSKPKDSDIQKLIKTKNIETEKSFANFVIGKSNSQAHVAALTCATNPGLTYNPLFIYGNSGLGKTHLLMSVANRVRESDVNKKVIYIDAGSFVDAVYEASKSKTLNLLKEAFYDADLLIVDDIQFLKGNKEKSQEIFFSIFTELVNNKKQICLAADKKPEDIEGLEERITTRFNAGLVVPILAPEYETSYQIVSKKISVLKDKNTVIDDEVISFIASNFSHDVRNIEKAINRLSFYTSFVEKVDHFDIKTTKLILSDFLKETNEDLNIGRIKKEVCNFYHISNSQICSNLRTQTIAVPRQIAMFLCRKHLNSSFESIGLEFGNRDHSTVMSSCTKIEKLVETDSLYKQAVNEIEGRIFQPNN